MPQTAVESMACGTPVVAFDTTGVPELVRHNETGRLAKLADATDLARQIYWMAQHPEERHRLAVNARAMIVNEFDLKQQVNRYAELYGRIVQGRRTSGQFQAA